MILYRISNCKYIEDLSGTGARLYGGRWNSEGRAMLYLASTRALCVLEVLVHLPPLMLPNNFCLATIEAPDNSVTEVTVDDLPVNWQDVSSPMALRQIGDAFLKKEEYLLMKVPSVIVPAEYNYLINPAHPYINKVKVLNRQPFTFDERLS
ncbi:RES family NAD+ phosphorylase [Mucilaginibacter gynuensis]|uniref:RES family NAD+ phosphorylase n=2 Tax=Mucilaginibacter gynuensis TaxID=1302236 RepID=A0ABP8HKT3_9SPHI